MTTLEVDAGDAGRVAALHLTKPNAVAALVLAHGAGAGMRHPFMEAVAYGLLDRAIATLRFQFPSMQAGMRRPDSPTVAQATVRAAVAVARGLAPDLPLFAGGKSFGGRMTSQAQADAPLEGVRGLVFFGFPLHPAGRPSIARAAHLARVGLPMIFLQGTRDALAEAPLIRSTVGGLGSRAALVMIEDADHSFHVRARSGRTDADVLASLLDQVRAWIDGILTARA